MEAYTSVTSRKRDDIIASFMIKEYDRVSDDQLNDFIYTLIWAGKGVYYAALNSRDYTEMRKGLAECAKRRKKGVQEFINWLDESGGEFFGYATSRVINY